MTEIKDGDNLLHLVFRKQDFQSGRQDIAPGEMFLQCAALRMGREKTFKPHQHILKQGPDHVIAQESWVVIRGAVKVMFYDCTGKMIHEDVLTEGDMSMTFFGGHNYLIMQDDTLVYEFKTGPYTGQQNDKVFI